MLPVHKGFTEPPEELVDIFISVYANDEANLAKALDTLSENGAYPILSILVLMKAFKIGLAEARQIMELKKFKVGYTRFTTRQYLKKQTGCNDFHRLTGAWL